MEDAGSSSSSQSRRHKLLSSPSPPSAVSDRIVRALRHPLLLLHRSNSDFFVLGATGNVYIVSLSVSPTCTCPDRLTPCKHILFVLIRVLGLPPEDPSLKRRTIRPCLISRLLSSPTLHSSLADTALRARFHQQFSPGQSRQSTDDLMIEEGTTCPVCLEEIEVERSYKSKEVVRCGSCKNVLHEECLIQWKHSRGRRGASCVICRARWRDFRKPHPQSRYLNLAAYVTHKEDDSCLHQTTGRSI